MKLGIIGYGRMGKMVEQIALKRKHQIVSIIDLDTSTNPNTDVDCYIDFSTAAAIDDHIKSLCELKIPIVIGVTGWFDKVINYEPLFMQSENKGIWSGNFSLGVNLYWKALENVARTFDRFAEEYDVMVHEYHHKNKIDSPSGTALQIADIIVKNSTSKNSIITQELQRKRHDNEIHVSSTRGGAIPGTHTVIYDSIFDTIEFKHTARSREGFAMGAVIAAENIHKIEIGLWKFSDIFDTIFG